MHCTSRLSCILMHLTRPTYIPAFVIVILSLLGLGNENGWYDVQMDWN